MVLDDLKAKCMQEIKKEAGFKYTEELAGNIINLNYHSGRLQVWEKVYRILEGGVNNDT